MKPVQFASLMLVAWATPTFSAEAPGISSARKNDHGFLVHDVRSEFQAGKTEIKILLPDRLEPSSRYPVIYVLPVEALDNTQYGDGLREVKKHDLANQHQAMFVAPTFSHLPWYADHATELTIRQESYFLNVVLPFVEKTYPAASGRENRLLLGFSKSGWGAWSLLVRHPQTFGRAAAWDAPLMMDRVGKYGSGAIFGTEANFAQYQLSTAIAERAGDLRSEKRLILLGFGGFRQDHEEAHGLLEKLRIPHEYRDGPERKHDWHSGWVPEAVDILLGDHR